MYAGTPQEALPSSSEDVERTHERIEITRHGHPVAVLISPDDLAALEETLDVLFSPEAMRQLAESRAGQLLLPPYAGTWSTRRGAYHVRYEVDDEQRVVTVTAVEHRAGRGRSARAIRQEGSRPVVLDRYRPPVRAAGPPGPVVGLSQVEGH